MDYKKLVKGSLAALMAAALTACGGSSSSEGSGTAAALKLGASGPITGDAAVYGLAVQHAAEIAIEEVNALGGTQIEMNFQDDMADGEKAVSAYNALMDWG
ncbi:MAG: ABC transporter substrate-binding protein, partial [Solobacterium sp.]|nr:ABC transporter substrate-binding protein [Solobacterium sp.]